METLPPTNFEQLLKGSTNLSFGGHSGAEQPLFKVSLKLFHPSIPMAPIISRKL